MSEPDGYAHLIGREFPGGEYTVAPWRAWLTADTLLDDPYDEVPHPVLAWMAGVAGWGMTWDEFFGWFDATADDGPMFGEHRTTMYRPLRMGATYRVSGRVVSAERKVGRRAGTMDIVGYELDLHLGEDHVARCFNSIVFPRRPA
ncbi:hypothetical protein [Thermocrispum municipale]|jgi:hypothetical protein|uniref:hypothetical protein n=1 Tax=Thermocrispum municipale TaxID=37926 RepID=UPI00040DA35D|nr:hypothetical protein [Thermocrispum municipale]